MNYLYENHDILNAPYEAFLFDVSKEIFPVRAHWHYFVEIIYMIEGNALITVNEQEYLATVGDLIFFHAGDVHSIYAASEMPLKYLVLKFDSNRISVNSNYTPKLSALLQYAGKSGQAGAFFPAKRLSGLPIRARFETCIREANGKEYGYDVRLHGEISSLLIEIIRLWQADGLQMRELSPICMETESSLRNITEYIDKHSHEALKVEELADMCHMSYSHFAKCFKELYGRSCKDYIELIRIEKGEELLRFTDSSLSEISQETGFADCSHFIRTFRKWKQTTPGKYRALHR
ncbi:MAG: AraC family transcriptional regulator [Roseburia sp.]|nr:AraC family transcriptional regulator [Roseburia sp.]MCM1242091.1 AraC family transcriptional regulator [Roseburia sp.]